MVGIVVVVLVAVGLSIAIEKRFAFSAGGLRLEREVASLGAEMAVLHARLDAATVRLAEMEGPRASAVEALKETRSVSAGIVRRKEDLSAARDGLRGALLAAEQDFSEYREECWRISRAGAVDEEIGTLTLRDGRSYQDAAITKVTDVGLEIRHRHGFARIHAPDLGPDWQQRFQWDDEDRRARLKDEALARERMSSPKPVAIVTESKRVSDRTITPGKRPVVDEPVVSEELAALRMRVSGWSSKVARLESEHDEAVTNSARRLAVPGGLETWSSRAARLRGELSKARIELGVARTRLAAVSP